MLVASLLLAFQGAGCRTAEEKSFESILAVYSEAYSVLESNVERPNDGIAALQKYEEDSRDKRTSLRKDLSAALAKLDEDQRTAFQAEAKKRYDPLRAQFATIEKRYPEERRAYLHAIITLIWAK